MPEYQTNCTTTTEPGSTSAYQFGYEVGELLVVVLLVGVVALVGLLLVWAWRRAARPRRT